uniref:Uncharacterized protein n=1 Tax=Rhizophora mucronata TaxID=61149 RepID=A0A2P2Q1W6_RHIMU
MERLTSLPTRYLGKPWITRNKR